MSSSPAPSLHSLLPEWRTHIERRLGELMPAADPADGVAGAMRDGVLAPGKRLRPLLMLAAGRAMGCASPALLDAACAVEMVHAASLVLDDMPCMDNARLRRGRPAVHLCHGQDAAVLASVALLARACAAMAALPGLDGAVRARMVGVLCEAVGHEGLVRGQYRDLREGGGTRSLQAIVEANEQKTGVLFACALEISALAAGLPQAVAALRAAAGELGQAFQLRDDLEDGAASTQPVLKDRHQDTGKSTLVALLGRAAVEQRLQAHLARAEALVRGALEGGDLLVGVLRLAFPPTPPAVERPAPALPVRATPPVRMRRSAAAVPRPV